MLIAESLHFVYPAGAVGCDQNLELSSSALGFCAPHLCVFISSLYLGAFVVLWS